MSMQVVTHPFFPHADAGLLDYLVRKQRGRSAGPIEAQTTRVLIYSLQKLRFPGRCHFRGWTWMVMASVVQTTQTLRLIVPNGATSGIGALEHNGSNVLHLHPPVRQLDDLAAGSLLGVDGLEIAVSPGLSTPHPTAGAQIQVDA